MTDGLHIMNLKIQAWNVRSISNKLNEMTKEYDERKVDITIMSETKKWRFNTYGLLRHDLFGGTNENRTASEAALLAKKHLGNKILVYTWISPRIIQVEMRIWSPDFKIFEIYKPVDGKQ
jgi:exonuclease III